ncbi:energy transducer TonB [Agriterribacter sp.]|uniref:energy transducer TonB n=1 Tax=Agriterribacter sp. TaxID=2821509 RepID=UPI002BE386F5|nr:energy transducer TonB [Agriterribacter sp.]HRP57502.1 energy transducer TonB [Agriterribacter sp.]
MRTLLIFVISLAATSLYAQRSKKNVTFYVFDENWKGCKLEEAKYLASQQKLGDTAYEWRYYQFDGPLLSIGTYKDKEANIAHGSFTYYGTDGQIDSSGYTFEGKKNDWWYHYTDSFTLWKKEKYEMGKLAIQMDLASIEAEREENRKKSEAEKHWGEVEAVFKGGTEDWVKYIQKNINFPDRARNLKKEGSLLLQFVVNTDGTTGDITILRSVEYSLDEEAIRLIKDSPKWRPAHQDGRLVRAFRRQPLMFQLPK